MSVDIIIFALIAIYILIKLYNVIGSDEFGVEPKSKEGFKSKHGQVINLSKDADYKVVEENNSDDDHDKQKLAELSDDLALKVTAVKKADKSFSLVKFLNNSEKAFELIIRAFASNDTKSIDLLTKGNARKNFTASLAEQKKLNNQVNIDIISFISSEIEDIVIEGSLCRITMNFVTEQIFFIKSGDEVIKGDKSKIEKIEDRWVFEKSLKSTNPIWHVVETQSV